MRTVEQQHSRLQALLPILVCPMCGGPLDKVGAELVSQRCHARYPVVDGVPILLPPELVEQGLGCRLGADDNVSMHPYSEASSQIIGAFTEGWVLDLGSGGKHIAHDNVVQMDVFRFPMTDVVGSADCLPFKANVFRAVVSQAVFEHLQYPEAAASEVWRVLVPDGVAKIDTAFLQPEHAYPHHYFNATEAGLRHWFRDFELEWSGVEPYQHPKWSLVWFLSVYFASLPDDQRKVLEPVGLGACVDVLSRLSRGVSTAEDIPIIQALDGLVPDGVRTLAAGVSVRAVKRVANGVVPRKSAVGGDTSRSVMLALERKIEMITRDQQMANDSVRSDKQFQVIAADRTRFLLHEWDQSRLALELQSAEPSTGWLVRKLVKRLFLAGRHVKDSADVTSGAETERRGWITFVVRPRHEVELIDLFFSLVHQTLGCWDLMICLNDGQAGHMNALCMKLAALDSRVHVVTTHGTTLERSQLRSQRWAFISPDTVLDFDAVLELQSLAQGAGQVPLVSDVVSHGQGEGWTMRCYGFLPEGSLPAVEPMGSGEDIDLARCQPWCVFAVAGVYATASSGLKGYRPAYVPKPLFRLRPFAVA